jgi:hypothetical protein
LWGGLQDNGVSSQQSWNKGIYKDQIWIL